MYKLVVLALQIEGNGWTGGQRALRGCDEAQSRDVCFKKE